ncbi:two-component sensor histidine kinase [Oscillochloris sp. ZM17-4]|uniref:sensor histidine kinase n=1 Tax=Oscillochloris sp. ZM17-4 TaxID=2866714 RepID=UPI001C72E6F8|nr:histidine kinase [Oscillochloris sp. ZM17-4]MBX0327677.1 two-component sensor histidine kinase [Oscillochloris sp. ZM17-4]
MIRAFQQLRALIGRHVAYPFALQGVVALALLMTPLSGLGMRGPLSVDGSPQRYWAMTAIVGLHLILTLFVPARRLALWAQILYLIIQCALTAVAQALFPTPLFDYVYLAIVLQSLMLFRPWLWIPFAVGVWALWSGGVFMATASALTWLQSNLALAFPATCAIIAAIIYVRQHRRSEQAQQMLQQMQQRYDSLSTALREIQQRVALEERRRLAQTLTDEVQAALARTEQSIAAAIGQAQSNLSRLQITVAQTRDSAGLAVERLRGAITTLRHSEADPPPREPVFALAIPGPRDELVISSRPYRVLSWVLPVVFISLSLLVTLTQHPPTLDVILPLLTLYALLLLAYIYTLRARNPLLLQIGLAGQTLAVVAMAITTQALPILLGLLLVLWQIALRLPLGQIALFLTGTPAAIGLLLARMRPQAMDRESLLVCAVAAVTMAGPLLLARRQLDQRRHAELRASLLSSEIEQQTNEVRTLAVAAERSRLAREFHDDLGSRLVLINLQLQLAEELAAESSADALAQLQVSRDHLREAWRSVLAVADAELPLSGDTLAAALESLAAQCRRSASVSISLRADDGLEELSPAVACTIYRVVQEGIANAWKHALPSQISVQLSMNTSHVRVTVVNDDRPADSPGGSPAGGAAPQGSYGLVGLRERADALGGGIEAGPLPEGGFRLMMALPVEGVA